MIHLWFLIFVSQIYIDRSKSSLNLSRGISNSSKKSLKEKKEDFQHRVKKLKDKLDSTKNNKRLNREYPNQKYNQTSFLKNNTSGLNNYTVVREGSMSPTSLGGTSSCANYQQNHARWNTAGGLCRNFNPQMVLSTTNDINRFQNISYFSAISNWNKNYNVDYLPDYKRDGATLLVDRIKRLLRKNFKPLKIFLQSRNRITDMQYANRAGLNTSYSTIQSGINKKRNMRNKSRSNTRKVSNSRKSNKSWR